MALNFIKKDYKELLAYLGVPEVLSIWLVKHKFEMKVCFEGYLLLIYSSNGVTTLSKVIARYGSYKDLFSSSLSKPQHSLMKGVLAKGLSNLVNQASIHSNLGFKVFGMGVSAADVFDMPGGYKWLGLMYKVIPQEPKYHANEGGSSQDLAYELTSEIQKAKGKKGFSVGGIGAPTPNTQKSVHNSVTIGIDMAKDFSKNEAQGLEGHAAISLNDATDLLQPVMGTSAGSVYHVIALGEGIKVAARYVSKKASIRVAGDWVGAHMEYLKSLGLKVKEANPPYASIHVQAQDQLICRKFFGAVIASFAVDFAKVQGVLDVIMGKGK
ncbi:MAG: hypothetical protein GWN00_01125 [Aliifodinibius sp.]|nr:hypothetical protein [Fodinibius sp.]NIV09933.1 hypothetical protein [Fodinibius sp.]NIY23463.1 hypothetical protein [Fodinibius sp.]